MFATTLFVLLSKRLASNLSLSGRKKLFVCQANCRLEKKWESQTKTNCLQLEYNRITSFGMIFVDCLINVLRIGCESVCDTLRVNTQSQNGLLGHHHVRCFICLLSVYIAFSFILISFDTYIFQ